MYVCKLLRCFGNLVLASDVCGSPSGDCFASCVVCTSGRSACGVVCVVSDDTCIGVSFVPLALWWLPGWVVCGSVCVLGKAPTPKGALLPQRIVSYKYLSVQLHS